MHQCPKVPAQYVTVFIQVELPQLDRQVIGSIGFLMNEALLLTERYLFRWRWQVKL